MIRQGKTELAHKEAKIKKYEEYFNQLKNKSSRVKRIEQTGDSNAHVITSVAVNSHHQSSSRLLQRARNPSTITLETLSSRPSTFYK